MGDGKGCIFQEAWIGRCGNDVSDSDFDKCTKHRKSPRYMCWCGEQAVRECSVASSLVCGQPLCEEHDCHRIGRGMTGTMPHSKKGRQQFDEWRNEQD